MHKISAVKIIKERSSTGIKPKSSKPSVIIGNLRGAPITTGKRHRKPEIFNIPPQLVEAAKSRKLTLLIGAGISQQAKTETGKFPSWEKLLEHLYQKVKDSRRLSTQELDQLNKLLLEKKFLTVAQALKQHLNDGEFKDFLEAEFSPKGIEHAEVHEKIFKLNPPIILTTNYDRLLEQTFTYLTSKLATCFTYRNSTEAHRHIRGDKNSEYPLIFKMHGSIDDLDSIILTEFDYRKLIYQEPAYRTLMSAIFVTHTILFLGFSLRDYELNLLLESLQESFNYGKRTDYILLPKTSTVKSIEIKQIEESFGIHVIQYKAGKTHLGILDFLNQLIYSAGLTK